MCNNTERQILTNIFKNPISGADLARKLKLTGAAISRCTSSLLEKGIICKQGIEATGKIGRNKILLDLNKNYGYVLGIALEVDSLDIAICNIKGEFLSRYKRSMKLQNILSYLKKNLEDIFQKIMADSGVKPRQILGAGITHVGSKKEEHDCKKIIDFLSCFFKEKYHLHVKTGDNAHSIAMAEHLLNEFENDFFFVKYGPRVGSAMWLQGNLFTGSHNSAGEIAHLIIPQRYTNAINCEVCGRLGCLESLVSVNAIKRRIKSSLDYTQLYKTLLKRKSWDKFTLYDIFSGAKDDSEVAQIMHETCFYLAQAIHIVEEIIDCKRIVLYGECFLLEDFHKLVVKNLSQLYGVTKRFPFQEIEIVRSKVEASKKVVGAFFIILSDILYA